MTTQKATVHVGLHVQHRAQLAQLLERAAAHAVTLTVVPALVMALYRLHQLSLKISIFRHGTCLVASAIVAAPGMAHLHVHHLGAELSIHRGRRPVMVPAVVVVLLLLLLYRDICEEQRFCSGQLQHRGSSLRSICLVATSEVSVYYYLANRRDINKSTITQDRIQSVSHSVPEPHSKNLSILLQ